MTVDEDYMVIAKGGFKILDSGEIVRFSEEIPVVGAKKKLDYGSKLKNSIYPGWPPAKLSERECELPQVGLPHSTAHEGESD